MREMLLRLRGITPLALILMSWAISTALARDTKHVYATGSSTVAPLVSELAQAFEVNNPEYRIDVETGGSSRGIADATRGTVDFGMVSRALKENEVALQSATIAWDGIAMIVHSSNPVEELSPNQIQAIYKGEIDNWREVGGDDREIVVVNKAQGRSTLELFLEHFQLKAPDIKADTIIGDNQQGIKVVSASPAAIGYVSIVAAEYEIANGARLKALPLEGIQSTRANVLSGEYPLRRPLTIVYKKGALTESAEAFTSFMGSSKAVPIIEEMYFVAPNS